MPRLQKTLGCSFRQLTTVNVSHLTAAPAQMVVALAWEAARGVWAIQTVITRPGATDGPLHPHPHHPHPGPRKVQAQHTRAVDMAEQTQRSSPGSWQMPAWTLTQRGAWMRLQHLEHRRMHLPAKSTHGITCGT